MKSEDYSSFKVHKHSTQPVYLTSNTCWLVPEQRITEPSPSMWLLTVLLMPEFWWVLCRERTWMQAKQPEWNAKQRCEPLHYGRFRERESSGCREEVNLWALLQQTSVEGNWVDEPEPAHGFKGQQGVPELSRNMKRTERKALGYDFICILKWKTVTKWD